MSRNSHRKLRHSCLAAWLVFAFIGIASVRPAAAQEDAIVATQGGASVTLAELSERFNAQDPKGAHHAHPSE